MIINHFLIKELLTKLEFSNINLMLLSISFFNSFLSHIEAGGNKLSFRLTKKVGKISLNESLKASFYVIYCFLF